MSLGRCGPPLSSINPLLLSSINPLLLSSINPLLLSSPGLTLPSLQPLRQHSAATHPQRVGGPRSEQRSDETWRKHTHTHTDEMSSYVSSECRRVSPSVHGNKFDTAHRKKAAANIFESVNQDALMRLFQKTGDMKAEERVRSIFSYTQDPEETARALMALKQRKKDKFLQIAGMLRQLLKMR